MLPVIGVFLCVAFGLYICGFVVGILVQIITSFVIPVLTLLGLVVGFGTMLGRMLTSVVSFFIKFFIAVAIFCSCVLPLISLGWRNLYHALPDIINDIEWHVGHLRDVFEDAINQQGEWLIYLWGIILVPLYYISNQIRNVARNENNMHRNNGENMAEFDNNEDADRARQFGDYHDDNVRNRQVPQPLPQPQRQRLYPVLPDINYNEFDRREANNNDNNVGNGFLNNNNVNVNRMNVNDERLCVICFNHERNVAMFPCGHTWLCEQCTRDVMRRNRLCPVCQGRILEYRTVYL